MHIKFEKSPSRMYLPSSNGSARRSKRNAFPECNQAKETHMRFIFQIHIYYRLQVEHWVVTGLPFIPYLCFGSHRRKGITVHGILGQLTFFQSSISHGFHFSMLHLSRCPDCQTVGSLDWLLSNQPHLCLFIGLSTLLPKSACSCSPENKHQGVVRMWWYHSFHRSWLSAVSMPCAGCRAGYCGCRLEEDAFPALRELGPEVHWVIWGQS